MNRRGFLLSSAVASSSLLLPSLVRAQRSRDEFVIGQSVDLSGPLQNVGRDYFTGAKLGFDQANSNGGIHGKHIRYIQIDDAAQPQRAVENVATLLGTERVDLLFGLTTDACVNAVINCPAFKNSNRLLFAPMSGADDFPTHERLIYLRASYAQEIATILSRFFKMGLNDLAIAHTADASSIATRNAAINILKARNAPIPTLFALDESGRNAAAVAATIRRRPPQATVILANTIPSALLARELGPRSPGLFLCVTSSVNTETLQQMLGPKLTTGIIVSRVVPDAAKGTSAITRDFTRLLGKYMDEAPTSAGLEGYLAARTLLVALQKVGDDTSLSMRALRSVRSVDLGGWIANFSSGNRASQFVDTSMMSKNGAMIG